MDNSPDVPLEEISWHSPQHVQAMGGFLHSNNVLFYFAESPFFDATSNNASLAIQAMHNENLRHFIETREAFEGRLKTMQGMEFVVAHDPLQESAAAIAAGGQPKEPSNAWVIRKQMRRRPGAEDAVQILATYFIVGDSIYMAPSVLSVVGRRLLSAVTSLNKVMPAASPLLMFSPSHGHTYTPPASKSIESSQTAEQSSEQLGAEDASTTGATGTAKPSDTTTSHLSAIDIQNTRNLEHALNLLDQYGDEYMDETPLSKKATTGPPDRLSTAAGPSSRQTAESASGTPAPGHAGSPPALKTDPATLAAAKRTEKSAEQTPNTPDTPSGSGSGKEKGKKRKSKSGLPSSR